VINSNLGSISHRFQDTATYSLKHSIENCCQTTADEDIVSRLLIAYRKSPVPYPTVLSPPPASYRLATIHSWQTDRQTDRGQPCQKRLLQNSCSASKIWNQNRVQALPPFFDSRFPFWASSLCYEKVLFKM